MECAVVRVIVGHRLARLLVLAAATALAAAAHGEANPQPQPVLTADAILAAQPERLLKRLREKKVVLLQEIGAKNPDHDELIVGFVLFEAPVERVYRFLTQTTRQIEYRPEITSIETLEWKEEGPIDRHRIQIVFNRFVYHLRWHLEPESRRLWWELDDQRENDLDRVYGSWELYAVADGGTLGRFTASVDVGNAVPDFLQDYITRRNLPRTMERNRRWVDSGGTYRP